MLFLTWPAIVLAGDGPPGAGPSERWVLESLQRIERWDEQLNSIIALDPEALATVLERCLSSRRDRRRQRADETRRSRRRPAVAGSEELERAVDEVNFHAETVSQMAVGICFAVKILSVDS